MRVIVRAEKALARGEECSQESRRRTKNAGSELTQYQKVVRTEKRREGGLLTETEEMLCISCSLLAGATALETIPGSLYLFSGPCNTA
jgi:hypothetical protein